MEITPCFGFTFFLTFFSYLVSFFDGTACFIWCGFCLKSPRPSNLQTLSFTLRFHRLILIWYLLSFLILWLMRFHFLLFWNFKNLSQLLSQVVKYRSIFRVFRDVFGRLYEDLHIILIIQFWLRFQRSVINKFEYHLLDVLLCAWRCIMVLNIFQ